jgi:serine/threonine-protein kinase RsbW
MASGLSTKGSACRFIVSIPADAGAISGVVDRVGRELEEREWRRDDIAAVQIALTEALANAVRHGCRGDISKRVQCSVDCVESNEVVIVVRDSGGGFDPRRLPDPLDPANAFKSSGRGIFLMRVFMDEVVFGNGGREVQMRKRKAPEK